MLHDLAQAMRDEDDGDALGPQAAQGPEEDARLVLGQRRGRLVQHQDARVLAVGLGDLDHLALADGQVADERRSVDRRAQALQERAGLLPQLAAVHASRSGRTG